MSADNWRACPKCSKILEEETKRKYELARSKYGIVTPQEYQRLLEDAQSGHNGSVRTNQTLEEYFEAFIETNGKLYISYSSSCEKCGFEFSFKVDRKLTEKELS